MKNIPPSWTQRRRQGGASAMHYARLEKSARLRRLLAFLKRRSRLGATTLEIQSRCFPICAVSTAVSELEKNGFLVDCEPQGRSLDGGNVFRYFLRLGGRRRRLEK